MNIVWRRVGRDGGDRAAGRVPHHGGAFLWCVAPFQLHVAVLAHEKPALLFAGKPKPKLVEMKKPCSKQQTTYACTGVIQFDALPCIGTSCGVAVQRSCTCLQSSRCFTFLSLGFWT